MKQGIILGIVLVIVAGLGVYFLPCPTAPQFIYFLAVLALAIALLSALVLGSIEISGQFLGPTVKAGGGFAIFIIVFFVTPEVVDTSSKCRETTPYKIILRDKKGQKIQGIRGSIGITLGDYAQTVSIDTAGFGTFTGISTNLAADSSAIVDLGVARYWFAGVSSNSRKIKLSGYQTTLVIEHDQTLCCISGMVMDRKTANGIANATIFLDTLRIITNKDGIFNIKIPASLQSDSIRLRIKANGYIDGSELASPALKTNKEIFLDAIPKH